MRKYFTKDKMKKYVENLLYVASYLWAMLMFYIIIVPFYPAYNEWKQGKSTIFFYDLPNIEHVLIVLFILVVISLFFYVFSKLQTLLYLFILHILSSIYIFSKSLDFAYVKVRNWEAIIPHNLLISQCIYFYFTISFFFVLFAKRKWFKNRGNFVIKTFFLFVVGLSVYTLIIK